MIFNMINPSFFPKNSSIDLQESDFVKVALPAQKVTRDQGGWLYHRRLTRRGMAADFVGEHNSSFTMVYG